jgi:alkyldihydroxyacetonephosphate synthase
MWAIKHGRIERIPDLVVRPETDAEVETIIELARQHDVCLIPYGGGTNVTDALRCPADERRSIVSVDLRRMNRVLWLDPENRVACIEAGANGREIAEQLGRHGFTLGHEPDSFEFSTLGGWIATNASGMKKNRYGNIEDLVLGITAITSKGRLERPTALPRESVGGDPARWLLGSEGRLGIVTRAVLKVFPLPEVQRHASLIFRDLDAGLAFLYDVERSGVKPASIRLMDNLQFQFGQALKPHRAGLAAWKSRLERLFVTRLKGFDVDTMSACTLLFEGSAAEVATQERSVTRLAARHGGLRGGAENGRRGYALTFAIAYIRDFMMRHHVVAESFETSVPWSEVRTLIDAVKQRLWQEHAKRDLPGRPFVCARVTQLYETGVCVYFYFGCSMKGVPHASEVYAEMERAARDEILRTGGSLSHHHGVGKLRRRFLPDVFSQTALRWRAELERAVDPDNVFGVGN